MKTEGQCFIGTAPCVLCRIFFPRLKMIEENGKEGGKRPADWPCHPDAGCAETKSFCKEKRQRHTQEEVGEGGCHEIEHGTAAAQHPIAHDLNRYDEIEGGDDVHIVYTCLNCGSTAFIQKQLHGGATEEEIEQEKRYADQNTEERPCPKAFGNPFLFSCAKVLSGEGGNAVGQGCHAGDGKGIQLLAGRKACNNGRAIAVDG